MALERHIYPVRGMSCAACAGSIESYLSHVEGVKEVGVNLANSTAWIVYDPSVVLPTTLRSRVQELGFDLLVDEEHSYSKQRLATRKALRLQLVRAIAAIMVSGCVMVLHHARIGQLGYLMELLLALFAVYFVGIEFHARAIAQLRVGRMSMDTLIALSTSISFIASAVMLAQAYWSGWQHGVPQLYFDSAAMIIAFILIGKWLEARAKQRTSVAIDALMGLQPQVAMVLQDGEWVERRIESLMPQDVVLVRAGERMPVDGVVHEGEAWIDESAITGEPLPVLKEPGAEVYAGTLNQGPPLQVKATRLGIESVLGQIIQRVEEAQGSKAPIQGIADRVAAFFVPIVLGIAFLTLLAWGFLAEGDGWGRGVIAAVAVLAVACPCALGLATPTAIMVGIGKAARAHVLVRNAQGLERVGQVDTLIIDKTGTLTEGKPKVVEELWLMPMREDIRCAVANLEVHSTHPLASAIADWSGIQPGGEEATQVEEIVGKGITGHYRNAEWFIGRMALPPKGYENLQTKIDEWSALGYSVAIVAQDGEPAVALALHDTVRLHAVEALEELRHMGIRRILASGDRNAAVKALATRMRLDAWHGDLLPTHKEELVRKAQARGACVGMVGDGINDAQALALADVGLAMGKGTDVAMGIASLTVASSDLRVIPWIIGLSRATMRVVRQNLFWAFFYNVLMLPIAAGALYPLIGLQFDPAHAAMAMALSSVSVVANSLRIGRYALPSGA